MYRPSLLLAFSGPINVQFSQPFFLGNGLLPKPSYTQREREGEGGRMAEGMGGKALGEGKEIHHCSGSSTE